MKKFLTALSAFAFPSLVFAQTQNRANLSYFKNALIEIGDIIDLLFPIIIAGAVVYFAWNVTRYVVVGDEGAKEQYKQRIIYGIIGLFVMVAVWGLVNLVARILDVETGGNTRIPELPSYNTSSGSGSPGGSSGGSTLPRYNPGTGNSGGGSGNYTGPIHREDGDE